ncbi:MAG: ATP-dependent DNA ligase [Nitrososphaeria archaeon]|nr:ATP-dependent DNA ligase [Nitrososphaeria archaeon]
MMLEGHNNSFLTFAEICEKVRGTSSKNMKIEIVSEYLKRLGDEDLKIACNLFSGQIFPPWENIELQVGYSTLLDILKEVSGLNDNTLREIIIKHGDLGEASEEILKRRVIKPLIEEKYDLSQIYSQLRKVAETTGKGSFLEKKRILTGIYLSLTPLEAKYFTKVLTGEMRIGLVSGLIIESISEAFTRRFDEVNEAFLLINDVGETAVLAKYGRLSEAKLELLHPTNFMLAESMQSAEEVEKYFRKELVCEFKLDGVRVQCHKKGEIVRIFSRRGNEVSKQFPEIVEDLLKIDNNFIFDGEIIAFKNERPLPFSKLQQRLQRKYVDEQLIEEIPLVLFVYDILYFDNEPVYKRILVERKKIIEKIKFVGRIKSLEYTFVLKKEEIEKRFQESVGLGYEGLMLKDPSSFYTVGKRGKYWIKLKRELDTIDAVIVAAERGHGKRAEIFSDYVFSIWDNNVLKIIGKAYSGLTDKELLEMNERLRELTVKDEGWRLIVRPEIVIEVAFNGIQKSSRHESGFALRFPRIKRIRDDKSIEEADTIEKVKAIYERQKKF